MLGQHNIRRSSLAVSEGHADVLFWQAQATLRTPCFADHFIQRVPCACRGGHDDINCSRIHSASQTVQASMRINVLPTVKAQGGGCVLLFLDGAPKPPRDLAAEREAEALAQREMAELEVVDSEGEETQPPPPPPPRPLSGPPEAAMIVELGGASFYDWPKRCSVPDGLPPTTPPPPSIRLDEAHPSATAPPPQLKEVYTVKLPCLKISGLDMGVPVASLVRSGAMTACPLGRTS